MNDDAPRLYVREGTRLVPAPAEDQAVARGYPTWPDKGPIVEGIRITVMCAKNEYAAHEELRVIHAVEFVEPGRTVYVMGPKPVYEEHIDGMLVSAALPDDEDPFAPRDYDGLTLPSPCVDLNYEITAYRLPLGDHELCWQRPSHRSNVLRFRVER